METQWGGFKGAGKDNRKHVRRCGTNRTNRTYRAHGTRGGFAEKVKPPLDVWRERIGYIVAYGVGHTQVISWRADVCKGMIGDGHKRAVEFTFEIFKGNPGVKIIYSCLEMYDIISAEQKRDEGPTSIIDMKCL